jgi:nucleoside 2-deoxyribosyltransferase
MPRIYLAGPITGLTYDGAQDWRKAARDALKPDGISAYSPLRQMNFLRSAVVLEGSYETHPLSTSRGIMTRDHDDCMKADLILANLLGADRVSIGTVMEIAWAYAYRVPVVAMIEPSGNVHDHSMIREALGYRVSDLESAIDLVRSILLPS